mmetsp:Transcript_3340/g.10270  ORF Transcript_3340/g.10270 Transcript_3340/m.10270 type:complete len:552 (+) Transcript_3340:485-2140(+)
MAKASRAQMSSGAAVAVIVLFAVAESSSRRAPRAPAARASHRGRQLYSKKQQLPYWPRAGLTPRRGRLPAGFDHGALDEARGRELRPVGREAVGRAHARCERAVLGVRQVLIDAGVERQEGLAVPDLGRRQRRGWVGGADELRDDERGQELHDVHEGGSGRFLEIISGGGVARDERVEVRPRRRLRGGRRRELGAQGGDQVQRLGRVGLVVGPRLAEDRDQRRQDLGHDVGVQERERGGRGVVEDVDDGGLGQLVRFEAVADEELEEAEGARALEVDVVLEDVRTGAAGAACRCPGPRTEAARHLVGGVVLRGRRPREDPREMRRNVAVVDAAVEDELLEDEEEHRRERLEQAPRRRLERRLPRLPVGRGRRGGVVEAEAVELALDGRRVAAVVRAALLGEALAHGDRVRVVAEERLVRGAQRVAHLGLALLQDGAPVEILAREVAARVGRGLLRDKIVEPELEEGASHGGAEADLVQELVDVRVAARLDGDLRERRVDGDVVEDLDDGGDDLRDVAVMAGRASGGGSRASRWRFSRRARARRARASRFCV